MVSSTPSWKLLRPIRMVCSLCREGGLSHCCHGRPNRSPPSHRRAIQERRSEVFHSDPSWSNDYTANIQSTQQPSDYSRGGSKSTLRYGFSLSPEGLMCIGELVEIRNVSRRFRAWDMLRLDIAH